MSHQPVCPNFTYSHTADGCNTKSCGNCGHHVRDHEVNILWDHEDLVWKVRSLGLTEQDCPNDEIHHWTTLDLVFEIHAREQNIPNTGREDMNRSITNALPDLMSVFGEEIMEDLEAAGR